MRVRRRACAESTGTKIGEQAAALACTFEEAARRAAFRITNHSVLPMQDLSTELAPELKLDDPFVDAVHTEFVQLLDAAARADDAHFLQAYDVWMDHCRQHFEREERWMASTKFGPQYCHAADHNEVLKVAADVREKLARDAQFELGRRLLVEVAEWFDQHVRTMDSMMVSHLKMLNFAMVDVPTEA